MSVASVWTRDTRRRSAIRARGGVLADEVPAFFIADLRVSALIGDEWSRERASETGDSSSGRATSEHGLELSARSVSTADGSAAPRECGEADGVSARERLTCVTATADLKSCLPMPMPMRKRTMQTREVLPRGVGSRCDVASRCNP